MSQMVHPERSSTTRSTPTGMENARHSAPAETYEEYRAFHERFASCEWQWMPVRDL